MDSDFKEIHANIKQDVSFQKLLLPKVTNNENNMKLTLLLIIAFFFETETAENDTLTSEEDERLLNDTYTTFVPPIDYKNLTLSAPQFATDDEKHKYTDTPGTEEDERILNETYAKFGPPIDYKNLTLPGPQFATDDEKHKYNNKLGYLEQDTFILRLRTITDYFSYNRHYEEIKFVKNDKEEIPIIKGQFGEHFKKNSGGFYIRTIGYTLDENGYNEFLIDLSTANTTTTEIFTLGGYPEKIPISSTVLITLTGGNNVG